MVAMVSDFGLSRDIYEIGAYASISGVSLQLIKLEQFKINFIGQFDQNYCSLWPICLLFQGVLPIRWMALESLQDYTCTSKSDV
jgi:hypothetical protein